MQNKLTTSFCVSVGLLTVTGMSFAETMPAKPVNPGSAVESKASAKQATGEVTFIEAKAGKLAVKTAEQDLSLNVQASATRKSLESIKVGDKVNVSYRDQGGILVLDAVSKAGARLGDRASSKAD